MLYYYLLLCTIIYYHVLLSTSIFHTILHFYNETEDVSRVPKETYVELGIMIIIITHRTGRLPGAYVFSHKTFFFFSADLDEVCEGFVPQILFKGCGKFIPLCSFVTYWEITIQDPLYVLFQGGG